MKVVTGICSLNEVFDELLCEGVEMQIKFSDDVINMLCNVKELRLNKNCLILRYIEYIKSLSS